MLFTTILRISEDVEVGTPVARCPPHRSRRAICPHRALQTNRGSMREFWLGGLHRFQSHKEPVSESRAKRRKKIQPEENSDRRRRKKSFQRIVRRTSKGRYPLSARPFCIRLISPVARPLLPTLCVSGQKEISVHPRDGCGGRARRVGQLQEVSPANRPVGGAGTATCRLGTQVKGSDLRTSRLTAGKKAQIQFPRRAIPFPQRATLFRRNTGVSASRGGIELARVS